MVNVASGVGKIVVLPGAIVSRIAAGEVVERPAAVVRELIDNSLDAGSTRISVEVEDGGLRLIRVTDDGEGMSRADAPAAFQRHATSKVRSEEDLLAIATLGFRGEALPSIAAISKIHLVTACQHEPVGTELRMAGGTIAKIVEKAAASGTRIEVSDLFYNTPARRKFLKTPMTEFSHISQSVQQAALAWPHIQVRLAHNGQEVLEYAAVSTRQDRVLQVYGARFLERVVPIRWERPGLSVEGFVLDPVQARASRTPQDLFVNRRAIKNATVSHAVYDAYGSLIPKGHHPVFVLFLDLDPHRVDVNVHPAKREVRFADQDMIHQAVRQAIRDALAKRTEVQGPGRLTGAPSESRGTAPQPEQLQVGEVHETAQPLTAREAMQAYRTRSGWEVTPLGQIGRTFLVAQVESELQVIDQHTAHERVLFERLQRTWAGQTIASQQLLIPEPVDLPPHGALLLQRHLSDLAKLGLEIEPFGRTSFLIRAIPALLGPLDYPALVQDLLEDLAQWESVPSLEERVRPVLASLACHGAVRAGRVLELPEIKRLIEDWIAEGLPMTCPHGRRVALRLSAVELNRIFGRA